MGKMAYDQALQVYEGVTDGAPRRVVQVPKRMYEEAARAFDTKVEEAIYWVQRAASYKLATWPAATDAPNTYWTLRKSAGKIVPVLVRTNGVPPDDPRFVSQISERATQQFAKQEEAARYLQNKTYRGVA